MERRFLIRMPVGNPLAASGSLDEYQLTTRRILMNNMLNLQLIFRY